MRMDADSRISVWQRDLEPMLCRGASLICIAMTVLYLFVGYGAYLDSDMASELTLAQHLVHRSTLISGSWYYSTEPRILSTQLVYTPLMALMGHDWRMVRTLGSVILLAMMGAVSYWSARTLGAKRRHAVLASGLSVSVCSPLYAQNVIIGAYYIPHAIFVMLAIGLYARWTRRCSPILLYSLLTLSFVLCMVSVRYLLLAVMPMLLTAMWRFALPDKGEELPRTRMQWKELLILLTAVTGAAGHMFSQKILSRVLHSGLSYYGTTGYTDWSEVYLGRKLQEVLKGLLDVLGYEGGVPLFGVQGITNALILTMLFAGTFLLLRTLKRERDGTLYVGILVLAFAGILSLAAFVLLSGVYIDRYWIGVTALGVPVMAACLSHERNAVLRCMITLLFTCTVLLTSTSCIYYSLRNPQVKNEMRMEIVEALREQGVDKGYATFWNANILTELSNGEIDAVSLEKASANGHATLKPYRWLEAEEDFEMDRPQERVFLLMGRWELGDMDAFLEQTRAEWTGTVGEFELYIIPSQQLLFEAMDT